MASDLVVKFFDQFAGSLGATVAQLTATEIKPRAELTEPSSSHDLWGTSVMQSDSSCRIAVGISERTGLFLARAMLSETPSPDASFTADDKELLVEFWKQAFGRASTDLKLLLNDMAIDYIDGENPSWQKAIAGTITLQSVKGDLALEAWLSLEMVRRLSEGGQTARSAENPKDKEGEKANNLDLLLEVPLAVSLRFGQRRMSLRDILQLASGSVIELDRQAEDAVDLLLDERLIARGQVVVVDGCYGLRVTEVCR